MPFNFYDKGNPQDFWSSNSKCFVSIRFLGLEIVDKWAILKLPFIKGLVRQWSWSLPGFELSCRPCARMFIEIM